MPAKAGGLEEGLSEGVGVDDMGPDQRALFESVATPLYEELLERGGIEASDPRLQDGAELEAGLRLLSALGLAHLDPDTATWVADEPQSAQTRVVSPLSLEGSRLLEESSQWSRAFTALSHAWRRAPVSSEGGPFTYLRHPNINPYIADLIGDCEHEMLTAQPQALRSPKGVTEAVLRDTELLERGAKTRTLYQHSARRSGLTRQYVAAMIERGGEVRTLDEFFNRMMVFDRQVALIPSKDDDKVAVAVREPSMVAYLVDIFERAWERARPFTSSETTTLKDIASEQRAMTLRMLVEGHPDPVSAKRLGVSPRTYAGYVADLKDEFEAETRFQLGYEIGRLGIAATEEVTPELD